MESVNIIISIICALLAYLIGSISPTIHISRLLGKNIMNEGSGNAGATNAARVLGLKWGLLIFALDFLKAFVVCFLAIMFFGEWCAYICSVAVVLGHVFSIFHKFKAGKGVAPSIGAAFAINWLIALICLCVGVILVVITKRVSVGSICSAIVFPIVSFFINPSYFIFSLIIALLIIFTHRGNIMRLIHKEEKPLNIFKKKKN